MLTYLLTYFYLTYHWLWRWRVDFLLSLLVWYRMQLKPYHLMAAFTQHNSFGNTCTSADAAALYKLCHNYRWYKRYTLITISQRKIIRFWWILYTAADFELGEPHVIKNEKVALDRLRVRQDVFLVTVMNLMQVWGCLPKTLEVWLWCSAGLRFHW